MVQAVLSIPAGRDPAADPIALGKAAARAAVAPTSTYYAEDITVTTGPREKRVAEKVKLKIQYDTRWAFAVFSENPHFHDRDELIWDAAARQALEKFAAANDRLITSGPGQEAGRPANRSVELDRPVKFLPETAALMAQRREDAAKREALLEQVMEQRRLLGSLEGTGL